MGCRCAYLDPRPSKDTVHLAYQQYYTHSPPGNVDIETMGLLRRIRRSMANGYKNWRYGTDFPPATNLGVVAAMILPVLRQRLDQGFRNLPRPHQNAHLLDVGFGSGAFLESAKTAGWKVAGVDPDPVSVESAIKRGLNVRAGGVEAFADMPESFDVVTMSHVIEHVHDPCKTLQSIYHLLKPGGFLWLSTPNIQSFGHEYYGRNYYHLDPPRHLVLFNWRIMLSTLKKIGFTEYDIISSNYSFASNAAKSEAIMKSLNPRTEFKVCLRHRLKGILAGIRTRFQPHRTEFIILKAYKS
jgi:2-polyprenyl-3-methyl-5-hydroxy-6-metoxy-1,4-benzoquinol methylase